MKFFAVLICIFALISYNAESGWKKVFKYYPNQNLGMQQYDIRCADSMNCISLASPGATGTSIIRSTNGGASWVIQYADSARKILDSLGQWTDTIWPKFKGARCLDYVTTNFVVVGHEEGQLTISRDRGYSWDSLNLPTDSDISDVRFKDSLYGIALSPNKVFLTTDAGITWTDITAKISIDTMLNLDKSYLSSAGSIHLPGYRSSLGHIHYMSTDGGHTWTQNNNVGKGLLTSIRGMSFINKDTGWVTGLFTTDQMGHSKDVIIATYDGGKNWITQLDTSAYGNWGLMGIYFANENEGIAWGGWHKMWRTNDGGKHWTRDESITIKESDDFTELAFPKKNTKKILGAAYVYGEIWLYEEDVSIGQSEQKFSSAPVLPNPADNYINIGLNVNFPMPDNIAIYNPFGAEVYSEKLSPSTNVFGNDIPTVRINISSLPPGVYFVRIGGRVEKFVKM